jgi:hypothetical protein
MSGVAHERFSRSQSQVAEEAPKMASAPRITVLAPAPDLDTVSGVWAFTREDVHRDGRQDSRELLQRARCRDADPGPWRDLAVFGVLSARIADTLHAFLPDLIREVAVSPSSVIVLVPWIEPPQAGTRDDGVVTSFLCTPDVAHALWSPGLARSPANACFELLCGVLNQRMSVGRLVVRQLPAPPAVSMSPAMSMSPATPAEASSDGRTALVMAHRGSPSHLATALRGINAADGVERVEINVGLDVDTLDEYEDVRARFPAVRLFQAAPTPAGPFVIRQALIEHASEDYYCLHDSDDLSCADRFAAQRDELERTGVDMIGCHELRVDEIDKRVEAHRLPLDITHALQQGYSEALLNGTVFGRRRAVMAIGGYSTDQRIASDTQFMLRASFSLRMRNIDGFYYLRRRHASSLTMAPETALGTPFREGLRTLWHSDFDAVRAGTLPLARSSLRRKYSATPYTLTPWPSS